ncbi:TNF receptor-associated factor 3 [Maniola jurtina]|uniref:TNF receptor-associated factor 3 n=1 Tax=Maniola jurtina TaxID=191418 RepID=UPI001E68F30E|nr:TNF receptor-associated factor 3 [Maniola jurtina]XP_045778219.1 TNF receptor-associated factor 3 [Maniola jurtina]XP_045778220.1 TNF receptor-associated factor 3 [Maniola jurtina]XP_045778221.1 TNF receptor-associated factor 3 [Maniola jurtina]
MSIKRVEADTEGVRAKESPCYFCNDAFEMGKLQNHLKQCGSILEQCPLRCGAWIQRKHRDTHVKECPQMEKSRDVASPSHVRLSDPSPPAVTNHTWNPKSLPLEECVSYLEKEVTSIKLLLAEESSHRDLQSTELENLRSKLVLVEERAQHFLSTLVSLRGAVDDEAERAANWAAQFKHDLSNVQLALQELQSQQLTTVMRLESAVSSLVHEQHERELLEQALTQHDNRIRTIKSLEEVIEYIKQTVEEERERNAESRAMLESELMESRRSSEQLAQLSVLRMQIQNTTAERPAIDRLAVLEVATADARAETAEQANRMDKVSRDLRALTKSYHKMRSELADFQTRVILDNPELAGDNGHLIWRIDNFAARMKDAKEKDSILTSPLFRTSKYGYTLKAEVHLNGIGKWKGRHITSTVRLVTGPYDPLLEWPCDLSVSIILRDQPANKNQAMDIVKSLDLRRKSSSKRHDYDETGDEKTKSTETLDMGVIQMKRQYIFIPHTSLDKFEYIKNDVMFLEFLVNQ